MFPSLVLLILCVVACIGWVRYACRASDTQDRLEYANVTIRAARSARDRWMQLFGEAARGEKRNADRVAELEVDVSAYLAELSDADWAKKVAQEEARASNAVRTHYYQLMQESAEYAKRLAARLRRISKQGHTWNVVDLEVRRVVIRELGVELVGRDEWEGPFPIGVSTEGEVVYSYSRMNARKLLGVS